VGESTHLQRDDKPTQVSARVIWEGKGEKPACGGTGGTSNKEPGTKLILTEGELNAIYLSRECLYIWVIFYFINIRGNTFGIKVGKECRTRG